MVHPNQRRGTSPVLAGGNIPDLSGQDDDGKFDKQLPHDGWELAPAQKNTFIAEVVGQIPRSGTIITVEKSNARNDKEWHLIVHDIAEKLDDHFEAMGLKRGERVIISGNATACFVNGMEFVIVPFNAIQGILRRRDGQLWVGSKYGGMAFVEGKPADPQAEKGK